MSDWTPRKVPLSKWPSGWLKLEVAGIIGDPTYLLMTDQDKNGRDWPVTDAEMRVFIMKHKGLVGGRMQ